LPEMIIIRRVLTPKLLISYLGIVTLGIIFRGFLADFSYNINERALK